MNLIQSFPSLINNKIVYLKKASFCKFTSIQKRILLIQERSDYFEIYQSHGVWHDYFMSSWAQE